MMYARYQYLSDNSPEYIDVMNRFKYMQRFILRCIACNKPTSAFQVFLVLRTNVLYQEPGVGAVRIRGSLFEQLQQKPSKGCGCMGNDYVPEDELDSHIPEVIFFRPLKWLANGADSEHFRR